MMSSTCLMSLQDSGADLRVLFHLLEFFRRELAGLLQHGFGHADLADVVQQAGHVDAIDLRARSARLRCASDRLSSATRSE